MITPLEIKNKTKTGTKVSRKKEIITINEINNLDYCLNMIESVIKNTKLPQELEYKEKIKDLENLHNYKIIEVKYENALKTIEDLRNNLKDLRETNTDLKLQLKKRK